MADTPKTLKAYGDTRDDGMVQVSFTLPVACGPLAKEAGRAFAGQLGLKDVKLACFKPAGDGFTFYVAYGRADVKVDVASLPEVTDHGESMSRTDVDAYAAENIGRTIAIVGAAIGSDAHSVGIDAIMNMKGFSGDYGLERYECFEAVNLGAQVTAEELVRKAGEVAAEVVLVSQIVTQKDIHVQQLTRLVELMEAEGMRDSVLLIVGGPYIDDRLAQELGYDAGFGRGTLPKDVATFIARRLAETDKET